MAYGTCHLLPRGNPREPRGNGTTLVFIFPHGGGELFSFGNDFAGPRDMPTGFVRACATGKVKSALPCTVVDE